MNGDEINETEFKEFEDYHESCDEKIIDDYFPEERRNVFDTVKTKQLVRTKMFILITF